MTTADRTASTRGGHLLRNLLLAGVASLAGALPVAAPARAAERVFIVTASRYAFTPDVIEVDEGDRLRIALRSEDVAHGFAIPDYGVDVTLPASGDAVLVDFVADRPGSFAFSCSFYCGAGHEDMRGRLLVRPAGRVSRSEPAGGAEETRGGRIDIDYAVVNVPTTLALPRHAFAFWLTHRFARPLGEGSFSDLAGDLFGLDGGAQIGLGLRFGVTSASQVGFYRTSDRTIQLLGQHRFLDQGDVPLGLALEASLEGLENFSDDYSPALTLVLSRELGDRAALYAAPGWVGNTSSNDVAGDDDTLVLGLGARLRVTDRVYLVGEVSPRLAGFAARPSGASNAALASFGVELRYGGHVFQLDVSNDLATTPAQVARGQQGPEGWFIGFNISRKFFDF